MDNTGGVTPAALAALKATRPWVRLISVITFAAAGLMLLGALLTLAGGSLFRAVDARMPMTALIALYVGLALVYFVPGFFLARYARAIARLQESNSPLHLEVALASQKSFWKFVGLLTALGMAAAALTAALLVGI